MIFCPKEPSFFWTALLGVYRLAFEGILGISSCIAATGIHFGFISTRPSVHLPLCLSVRCVFFIVYARMSGKMYWRRQGICCRYIPTGPVDLHTPCYREVWKRSISSVLPRAAIATQKLDGGVVGGNSNTYPRRLSISQQPVPLRMLYWSSDN